MERTGICNKQKNGIILSTALGLIVIAYSLLYFNNTFPISEGWGINYAEMICRGKVPYRDFYYYLPPLNLLIDTVFWKLSFGMLLVFRGWYLAQRVLIYVLLFRLLRKYFNQYYAFLACVLTVILATGDVYDLIGDYNQTMALLTVLLVNCAVNFASALSIKKKKLHMAVAGGVLGLLFLNKQTIFAATCITFLLLLTATCIIKKDKHYWWYCFCVAGGILVPVIITFVYLGTNDALVPFFDQVFLNVDGKGSLISILVQSITSRLWHPVWLVGLIMLVALVLFEKTDVKPVFPSLCLFGGIFLHFYSNCLLREMQNALQIVIRYRSAIAALFGCAVLCGLIVWRVYRNCNKSALLPKEPMIAALCSMLCLAATCSICLYSENFAKDIYFASSVFGLVQKTLSLGLFLGTMVILLMLLYRIHTTENEIRRIYYEQLLFVGCGAFSLMYAGVMASGSSNMAGYSIRLSLPFVLCLILSVKMKHSVVARLFKGCIIGLCIFLSTAVVAQKIACSYSWWGSYMAPRSEKTFSVDIPAMAGIRVSAQQKELYETITYAIEEYTDDDAVIWGYPHIKLFNVLTDRYEMDTFVPVLFYDVVADLYVEKEVKLLAENPPEVVVWEDIPNCIETHERVFRNGELLKQREIIDLFNNLLPESYKKVVQIDNVTLYIRNDVHSEQKMEQ